MRVVPFFIWGASIQLPLGLEMVIGRSEVTFPWSFHWGGGVNPQPNQNQKGLPDTSCNQARTSAISKAPTGHSHAVGPFSGYEPTPAPESCASWNSWRKRHKFDDKFNCQSLAWVHSPQQSPQNQNSETKQDKRNGLASNVKPLQARFERRKGPPQEPEHQVSLA